VEKLAFKRSTGLKGKLKIWMRSVLFIDLLNQEAVTHRLYSIEIVRIEIQNYFKVSSVCN
jgi:hypothetical protein